MSMVIEQVFPAVVDDKSDLRASLVLEAQARGADADRIVGILAETGPLANALTFKDKLTGLWRYEFGVPFDLGKGQNLLGTHMWVETSILYDVLTCADARLSEEDRKKYLARVGDPAKHRDFLAEMFPALRVGTSIPTDFEVAGLGEGNKTVDGRIGPINGRSILLDVKRRSLDLIEAMTDLPGGAGTAPEPSHDAALMFRSIQRKFKSNDPAVFLQGAWIATEIAQNESELRAAFDALDAMKVHFVVLGDHKADAYVLARNPADEAFVREVLGLTPSSRFTFTPQVQPKRRSCFFWFGCG